MCRAVCWAQEWGPCLASKEAEEGPRQACRLAPWVPRMSSSTGLRGHPGLGLRPLPPKALSMGSNWHRWLGPNGLGQGPGSGGRTGRRAGSGGLVFRPRG